jgi:hypothetical protein
MGHVCPDRYSFPSLLRDERGPAGESPDIILAVILGTCPILRPPTGPFAGAEEVKALTGIITEGRRNQQQRGQSEEKKAFHEYPPYPLGVFANNFVLTSS